MDSVGLAGAGAPLTSRYLSGGTQNEIYELTRGDLRCVMRIPPTTAPADRDKGIVREYRIIEALAGTDVTHTEAIALSEDTSVLGRTFYLKGLVDGWWAMDLKGGHWPDPFDQDHPHRNGLAAHLATRRT